MNATIDEATGKVSFHFDTLPSQATAYPHVVRFTFADGSTMDYQENFYIDGTGRSYTAEETMAGNLEFGYDVLKNMKPGNSYVADPYFYTGRMQPEYFFPEDATFSFVDGNYDLQPLSIDEKTGQLSFTFPEDVATDFSTTVKVCVRYSDASVSEVPVTLAVDSADGVDSLPVDPAVPNYIDDGGVTTEPIDPEATDSEPNAYPGDSESSQQRLLPQLLL